MSDHDHSTKPADTGDGNPVSFTPDEDRQLCAAVAAAVSEVLGGMPVQVSFHVEDAAFLVAVVGQVPPGEKN